MKKIRVVVADDHEMVRAGLSSILAKQADIDVVGEASNGLEAVRLVAEHVPHVVLMDLTMPVMNGVDAMRQILAQSSNVKVIAMSIHYDHSVVAEVLKAGACGYLLKDSASDELVSAVRTSQRGETYLSSKVTQVVVSTFVCNQGEAAKLTFSPLSTKQRGVLQLLAEGKSNKEVASCLSISPKTVEAHRAQIMDRLQIHTIAGLTKYAIREGLTSVDT